MMIDNKLVEQARNADMIAFLTKHCGFTFTTVTGGYRCKQHPSLAIKDDRRSWYWHSKGEGGYGLVDYLMKIEHLSFREAVETAKSGIGVAALPPEYTAPKQLIELFLPEKAGIPLRLYDYLCIKRGIDSYIVNTLMQEGKLYEDKRRNIVVVGYDPQNKPRFASVRGTYGNRQYRTDCAGSDKRYGFNMAYTQSKQLYIFESAIDAMSHASLANIATCDKDAWKEHNRLSLAGTSDIPLPFFLSQHPDVKELVFCLDNDLAGRKASAIMTQKYAKKGFQTRIELPKGKDFNEDLTSFLAKKTHQKPTKSLPDHPGR